MKNKLFTLILASVSFMGLFSYVHAAPSITVTSPNGGEALTVGNTYRITWTSANVDSSVHIGYSFGPGSLNWITTNAPNTGYYDWNVNIGNTANTQVKIDVSGYQAGVGSASDQSDNFFTVNQPASVKLISPNGGEKLTRGNSYTISWTSVGDVGAIDIFLMKGNLVLGDIGFVGAYPATPTSFNWKIADSYVEGGDYKIRVSNQKGTVLDESDMPFNIVASTASGVLTLAPGTQPQATLATQGAINVPLTRVKFTASGDDVVVNAVGAQKIGLWSIAAVDSIALLDENGNRIGSAKSIGTIYSPFTVKAGQAREMTIAVDMNCDLAPYTGQVIYLSVIGSSGPITGTGQTINASLPPAAHCSNATTQTPTTTPVSVVCTQDAYQCPNGSYVSRVAPSCAFASCPVTAISAPTPVYSPASSSNSTIQLLLQQIQALQNQINSLKSNTGPQLPTISNANEGETMPVSACLVISYNLTYRSRDINTNGDVSALQDFLQAKGHLNSEPTGFFGLLTLGAVKKFQSANGIESTGFVGPLTRAKIKNLTCNQ
ncbi:hypothetical protein A2W54_00430 [Candidatus Giovannonibacteria bacterium RIFCSPHIGHO2_02_43_13]|uniref:Peptidoglycan binding-like domain-containing protein n=1 Tax=Candidatus Giovannonibacteria bacterium RIFCSPHIGHO2_02_43_13 TaxID=1798330 RepID=A0A1F5WRN1_9BACT|nr:MAG: hypothetical protein UW28_C0042G0004 [Parcubacteria group bacterium GW2011_GWA2_44_13]OGF74113.1 MAG: hypothetical protein A3E06_01935 [Candidatus Giovannonibacteria bacterium RIFCSPHIGHO2_12_FULL_44_42]OGF78280.1 MAG: hypothetical protein A2W54_00430 [Candidatus Giovannonibacteria bacterium RIFCSPHIGHO2_02_43_13]OGF96701.1 MAG: hypothetical protein A3H08_03035 [Candidatus Giovannonibacteria bacterium RIFCSPLOWO2_12_FULL_44_32]